MDEIELTQLFVQYAECQRRAAELRTLIEAEVLNRGESKTIAGVKAMYYKAGFETPDYKSAGANAPEDIIAKYTTVTTSTKWAEVCKAAGIEATPGKEKPARVIVL